MPIIADQIRNKLCDDRPPLSSHAEHRAAATAARLASLLFTAAVADREKCPGDSSASGCQTEQGCARGADAARSKEGVVSSRPTLEDTLAVGEPRAGEFHFVLFSSRLHFGSDCLAGTFPTNVWQF